MLRSGWKYVRIEQLFHGMNRRLFKVKVRALFTGCDLTEGKIYDVIFEYDTVYELQCDTGQYCRPKTFFEIVEEE